jgi:outer membrane protein assembly factor BamB
LDSIGLGKPGWPRWRGPNGDGISRETDWDPMALAGGLEVLWSVDVGIGYSSVVFSGNRLLTLCRAEDSLLICLEADTGAELWSYQFDERYLCQPTPCTDGRFVYALHTKGELVCLNVNNGELRWKRHIGEDFGAETLRYGYAQSPVLAGDILLLNVNKSGIGVNKKTGELVWASEPHTIKLYEGYYATPVVYERNGSTYALLFSGTGLFAVDVKSGEPMWFHEWMIHEYKDRSQHCNAADPVLFGDEVFISSSQRLERCALLSVGGGEPRVVWQNENLRNHFSSSVLVDGYLYGFDNSAGSPNALRCLEWQTGKVIWEKQMRIASITAAGDRLIVLEGSRLHILRATPSAYTEITSCELPVELGIHKWWTPPVLYRGRIYCRNYTGDLVCIDVNS